MVILQDPAWEKWMCSHYFIHCTWRGVAWSFPTLLLHSVRPKPQSFRLHTPWRETCYTLSPVWIEHSEVQAEAWDGRVTWLSRANTTMIPVFFKGFRSSSASRRSAIVSPFTLPRVPVCTTFFLCLGGRFCREGWLGVRCAASATSLLCGHLCCVNQVHSWVAIEYISGKTNLIIVFALVFLSVLTFVPCSGSVLPTSVCTQPALKMIKEMN